MAGIKSYRMDNVNWRMFIYFFAIPVLLFYTLALTGCVSSSPGMPEIFLVQLQMSDDSSNEPLQVRVGYFGLCAGPSNNLQCHPSHGAANSIESSFTQSMNANEIDIASLHSLVNIAGTLQSTILVGILAGGGVCFVIALILLWLLRRNLKMATNTVAASTKRSQKKWLLVSVWLSIALALVAVVSSMLSAKALHYATSSLGSSSINISTGASMQGLQWSLIACSLVFAIGVSYMFNERGGNFTGMAQSAPLGLPRGMGGRGLQGLGNTEGID